MLEPFLTQLNCGEKVAPDELKGIVKFLEAAELEATKGFNLNALSFAVSIWYCDLSGSWARSLQSDVTWIGAQLKGLQGALRPLGGIASRGIAQLRHRNSSAPGRCRTTTASSDDDDAVAPALSEALESDLNMALEDMAVLAEELALERLQLDLVSEDPIIVPLPGDSELRPSPAGFLVDSPCSSCASSEAGYPSPTTARMPHSALSVDLLLPDEDRGGLRWANERGEDVTVAL